MTTEAVNRAKDALLMAVMGSRGPGHMGSNFMMDAARSGGVKPERLQGYLELGYMGPADIYEAPDGKGRAVVFSDGSSVYVHPDGFVTPMGSRVEDVQDVVDGWRHLSGPGAAR